MKNMVYKMGSFKKFNLSWSWRCYPRSKI